MENKDERRLMGIVTYEDYLKMRHCNVSNKELLDEYIVMACLEIAENANFPTDYDDVRDHLFENDDYIRLFLIEYDNVPKIKGFLIAALEEGYNDNVILHCHGIIIDRDYQGMGYSKKIVEKAIDMTHPDIVTAKTHNPRCFNTFANLDGALAYFPNEFAYLPEEILQLAKTDEFISNTDAELIYRSAYPDEKIQQSYRNKGLSTIFDRLSPTDAQAVITVLNQRKLNLSGNVFTRRRAKNEQ